MSEAFHLRGVRKAYKGFTLDIKDLGLERGYVMGMVGQNGAGKSTTIKILMNLIYPDAGDVEVLGLRQPADDMEIKRRVGYVSEEPSFYDEMSVGWLAGLVRRYYPTWDEELYHKYLRKFELDPHAKVKELSKGMKVKLALMLALAHRPELLILDEPTSGIDPIVRHELLEEIADIIRDERRTVLFSSHITQDVEQVADYVVIIERGRVVESTDKESLLERWRKVTGTIGMSGEVGTGATAVGVRTGSRGAAETGSQVGVGIGASVAASGGEIASMFREFKSEGGSFVGVTDSFSKEWLNRLKEMGANNIKTMNVGLDEILVSIAGKEG